jgi:hypothetical protein
VPTYHRPYPLCYDYLKTPDGWWVPDFYEFSGEDNKTTVEHISLYLSQLGFTSKEDYMRVWNFPLPLIGIAFAWFTSLPRCTVGSWSQLEEQFYEYFGKTNEKRPITIESLAKRGLLVGMREKWFGCKQRFGYKSRTTQCPFRINHISKNKSCYRKAWETPEIS